MTAGLLKTRCELITKQRVSDGAGGWTSADTVEQTVWGNLKTASWSQQDRADKLEQRITHTLTIRWQPDLARNFGFEARVRITDAGGAVRTFAVRTVVDPDNRRRFLELGCLEGGPE